MQLINYLAGGVPFGPMLSANITPDAEGKPNGLSLEEFAQAIRTGTDPRNNHLLQVMPWPIFRTELGDPVVSQPWALFS